MKVAEHTANRLVLVHRPWVWGAGLVGSAAVVAWVAVSLALAGDWPGAAMMTAGTVLCVGATFVFVRPARVVLDRRAGRIEITEWTLLGRRARGAALEQVTGARIGRSRETFEAGTTRASRAVVVLRDGALPLADAYMGHRPAARAVAAINRWLGVT